MAKMKRVIHRYSEEDIAWAKSTLLPALGETFSATKIPPEALKTYYNRFGRKITPAGLSSWLRKLVPSNGCKRGKKNPINILNKSQYILLMGENLMGFETDKEVKKFIETSQIIGGVTMFVRRPIKISYNIEL